MSEALSLKEKESKLRSLINSDQFNAELGKLLQDETAKKRMLRVFASAWKRNPKLLQCSERSLLSAFMVCGELNLEPNTPLNQIALVPFKSEVVPIIMYQGYLELARRAGLKNIIGIRLVYENEPFEYVAGLHPDLQHRPLPPEERGAKIVGGYCILKLDTGEPFITWMWKSEIDKIRKSSRAGNIWRDWEEDMMLKTVLRKALKMAPISHLKRAVGLDENAEFGEIDNSKVVPSRIVDKGDITVLEDITNVDGEERSPSDGTGFIGKAEKEMVKEGK